MNQNRALLYKLFTLFFQLSFSQDITIPFRDGTKWGFCNQDAEMLIAPQFDDYEFGNTNSSSSSYDYIYTKNGNLKGLIIDGKEILKPIYTEIYEYENLFSIKADENGGSEDRILPDGKSLFDKKYAKISGSGRIGGSYYLYILLNFDGTEDVLAYDAKTNKIIQKLYENIYSITRLPKQFDESQYTFLIQKKEKSNLVEESWNLRKLPFEKSKSGFRYITEAEFLKYFSDKYYQNKWNSNRNDSYQTREIGDYDDVVVPSERYGVGEGTHRSMEEAPSRREFKPNDKVNKNYQFIKNKEGVALQITTNYQSSDKELINMKLDVPLQDVFIQQATLIIKNGENTDTFYNYIEYKKQGKTVLIFANDIKNPVAFDYVDKISTRISTEPYNANELIFKVGKKDKNNQLKYGFYSNYNKLIVDFMYDDLELTSHYTPNGNRLYIAENNNKFGIIQSDGTIVIPIQQDKFEKVDNKSSYAFSYQFKNNNKYGLITALNKTIIKTEAIFNYPIKNVIQNYPNINNKKFAEKLPKSITLLELMDENGKSMGFANINGTHYFKD